MMRPRRCQAGSRRRAHQVRTTARPPITANATWPPGPEAGQRVDARDQQEKAWRSEGRAAVRRVPAALRYLARRLELHAVGPRSSRGASGSRTNAAHRRSSAAKNSAAPKRRVLKTRYRRERRVDRRAQLGSSGHLLLKNLTTLPSLSSRYLASSGRQRAGLAEVAVDRRLVGARLRHGFENSGRSRRSSCRSLRSRRAFRSWPPKSLLGKPRITSPCPELSS